MIYQSCGPCVSSLTHEDRRGEPVYIYALTEPRSLLIRYVGKSSDPEHRLSSHMSGSASYRVRAWVAELKAHGERPRVRILLRVNPGEDAAEAERNLIAICDNGCLLNGRGVRGQKKLDARCPDDQEFLRNLAASSGDRFLASRLNKSGVRA